MRWMICLLWLPLSLVHGAPDADLWEMWTPSDEQSGYVVDHEPWQRVLDRYVASARDGINRVNYAQIAAGEGAEILSRYLDALASVDPRRLNRQEQFAYWVNLYNAATVDLVLDYPDEDSIMDMGGRFFSIGPWEDEVLTIAGEPLSLNDIEHRILRPIWQDHRIHYAVNCASVGCPNLRKEAFTGTQMERSLVAAEADYLGHERGVSVGDERIVVSRIFDWYQADFGEDEAAVVAYLARHHAGVAEFSRKADEVEVDYAYDWDLNSQNPR